MNLNIFNQIETRYNNEDVTAAVEAARERFGDAKKEAYESQGVYDTDEGFRVELRGEAQEVAAAYETSLRNSDYERGEKFRKALAEVDAIYSAVVDALFEEGNVA